MQPRITNPNPGPGETRINIYGYVPSFALGVATVAIFALYLVAHLSFLIWTLCKQHQQRRGIATFELLFLIGCILEIIGYSFRIASHANPYLLRSFVLQYFMIVVAPVFFSAGLYYAFSLFIQKAPQHRRFLPVSPRLFVGFFVLADVVTIIVQVAGAALIGVSESSLADGNVPVVTPDQANHILTAGLAVQCASFCAFLLIVVVTIQRIYVGGSRMVEGQQSQSQPSHSTEKGALNVEQQDPNLCSDGGMAPFFVVLLASSILVFLRTVFRLAETASGVLTSISTNEDLFAALETAPVLAAIFLWSCLPIAWLLGIHERRR